MKKKNVVSLILTLLLSTGVVHAKITNKAFLMEIFNGCIAEGKDYDDLAKMIGVGGTFEYCGCATNEMSKNMNIKDVMNVGIDVLVEGGEITEGEMSDKQLAIALRNKNFSNAIVECMSQVVK
jgi:hypothetical protein